MQRWITVTLVVAFAAAASILITGFKEEAPAVTNLGRDGCNEKNAKDAFLKQLQNNWANRDAPEFRLRSVKLLKEQAGVVVCLGIVESLIGGSVFRTDQTLYGLKKDGDQLTVEILQ